MKLTLEARSVFVSLSDPHFSLGRLWSGVTDDGTPVFALIACVSSMREPDQAKLDDDLKRLPPPKMFLDAADSEWLAESRIA